MWEMRNVYKIVVGKLEGRRSHGRHRRRWEDDIKMYLREIGGYGFYSSGSEYGQVAGFCARGNEPSVSIKSGECLHRLSILLASQGLCSMEF
jgi:hypothetical protein